jgi:hypothetical protein
MSERSTGGGDFDKWQLTIPTTQMMRNPQDAAPMILEKPRPPRDTKIGSYHKGINRGINRVSVRYL